MSNAAMGVVVWVVVMIYCVILAFLTNALPLAGTIVAVVTVAVVFWLMAIKGKAAA